MRTLGHLNLNQPISAVPVINRSTGMIEVLYVILIFNGIISIANQCHPVYTMNMSITLQLHGIALHVFEKFVQIIQHSVCPWSSAPQTILSSYQSRHLKASNQQTKCNPSMHPNQQNHYTRRLNPNKI